MDQFVVSARKYRPDTFESVVGQQAITTTLKNAIRSGHIAQSFLFCGPRGVGKTTCARILAKTINCMNPSSDMESCGECESCKGFQNNASQNIYELDAASNRSVESMRTLVEQVRIPPQIGKYKVYIIDEVHMLTTEAFNAFLKTLEEPPAYAKFILATTEKNKILPTILSRCQISDFKRIQTEDMVKHLQNIAGKEGIKTEEEGLRIIAQKADGGLRDALSMFDQVVSFSGAEVTYAQVISLLNILDYDYYFRFTDFFLKGEHVGILSLFSEIIDRGFDPQHFINGLNQHLRQLLLSTDAQTLPLMELSESLQERYGKQAKLSSPMNLLQAMDLCNRCDLDYRASNNKRLLVEITLLQICSLFGASPVFQDVVFQSTEVEDKSSKETTLQVSSEKTEIKTQNSGQHDSVQHNNAINTDKSVEVDNLPKIPQKAVNIKSSLSIKDLKNSLSAASADTKEENSASVKTDMADFSDLKSLWDKYAESIKAKEPSLYTIIANADVKTIADSNSILVSVANSLQAQIFEENKLRIGNYLRKALNCQQLLIETKVNESLTPDIKIYSAQDKYKTLEKQNPILNNLRDSLKLGLDL